MIGKCSAEPAERFGARSLASPSGSDRVPAAIRAGLLPEDRERFDAALETALGEVRASLDPTDLFSMLERWRRLAVVQSDPAGFARLAVAPRRS